MPDYLLQEDGVSKFSLEDLSGFIILETYGPATAVNNIFPGVNNAINQHLGEGIDNL